MPVHTKIDKPGIYFITFTCFKWLPLIELSGGHDAVYNFFTALLKQQHTVLAYVIMPNHLHLLLHYNGGKILNTVIGNGKRFMAYELVRLLEQKGELNLLQKLQTAVKDKDRSRGKKHEVWIDGFDVKECKTSLDYLHSSAQFYFNGKQRLFKVKDYREFVNWEEMYE